jgi:hypothetical protein
MLSAPPRQCEQVLSHFLSDTIDSGARDAIFIDFKTLLQRVIALDADLGWLSFETLVSWRSGQRTRRFGQATSSSTIDPMTPRSRFSIPFSTSSQNHFEFSERYVAGDT